MKLAFVFFITLFSLSCSKQPLPSGESTKHQTNITGKHQIADPDDENATLEVTETHLYLSTSGGEITLAITETTPDYIKGNILSSSGWYKDFCEGVGILWFLVRPGKFFGFTRFEFNSEEINGAFASDEVKALIPLN